MLQNVVGAKLHKSHTTFFFNPNFFLFSLGPFLLASQNVLCYKIYFIAQVLYLVINFRRENSDFGNIKGFVQTLKGKCPIGKWPKGKYPKGKCPRG